MVTFESSLRTTNSTLVDNYIAYNGGIMATFESLFDITNSILSATLGGVMLTSDSLFNITSSTFTDNSHGHI